MITYPSGYIGISYHKRKGLYVKIKICYRNFYYFIRFVFARLRCLYLERYKVGDCFEKNKEKEDR